MIKIWTLTEGVFMGHNDSTGKVGQKLLRHFLRLSCLFLYW